VKNAMEIGELFGRDNSMTVVINLSYLIFDVIMFRADV